MLQGYDMELLGGVHCWKDYGAAVILRDNGKSLVFLELWFLVDVVESLFNDI